MKKILLLTKIFIFSFFSIIIIILSFYVYAFITPKFQINTSKNIVYYDSNGEDIFSENLNNVLNKLEQIKNGISYKYIDEKLILLLMKTGSHSELFKK